MARWGEGGPRGQRDEGMDGWMNSRGVPEWMRQQVGRGEDESQVNGLMANYFQFLKLFSLDIYL